MKPLLPGDGRLARIDPKKAIPCLGCSDPVRPGEAFTKVLLFEGVVPSGIVGQPPQAAVIEVGMKHLFCSGDQPPLVRREDGRMTPATGEEIKELEGQGQG